MGFELHPPDFTTGSAGSRSVHRGRWRAEVRENSVARRSGRWWPCVPNGDRRCPLVPSGAVTSGCARDDRGAVRGHPGMVRCRSGGHRALRREWLLSFDELPEVLTVEEAAEVLRIGRTLAYELARRFEVSDGTAGLPVLRIGRVLRVPKSALARVLTGELPLERALPISPAPDARTSTPPSRRRAAQLSMLEQPEV